MPAYLPDGAKLEPFDDWVLIRAYQQKSFRPAGKGSAIITPVEADEETYFGRVYDVGPGRLSEWPDENGKPRYMPMDIRVGEDISFRQFQGNRYKIGTQIWIMLRRDDILARVNLEGCGDDDFGKYYEWCEEGSATSERLAGAHQLPGLEGNKEFNLKV
ncbi:MAG: co-chaperone GroES [Dehalococcoidia bacterium]